MAHLFINNLKITTVIGCLERERVTPQEVVVSLKLEFDARQAAGSDELADTVDYAALSGKITRHVESSRYRLLEKLAGSIMDIIYESPQVRSAAVRVFKPGAIANAESAGVEITR
jgi:dihydroneopterin aldolase